MKQNKTYGARSGQREAGVPRLRPLEISEVGVEALSFYDLDESRYGQVLTNTKLYAYNLPVLKAMKGVVSGYAETDALPLSLKALVRVQVALINGCLFCADLHSSIGMGEGVAREKLEALGEYRESWLFTESERTALEYAERVTYSDRDVSDKFFTRLQGYFNKPEIVELTFTIAVENLFSKFHHALEIESEGFCPVSLEHLAQRKQGVGPAL